VRELEMGFLGKITASMTHEIKNTLAIILESSGLLSDLLTFSEPGSFPHQEKFQKVLGTINEQVNRGVVLATRLNTFAHSMDDPLAEVKVANLLELIVSLMQRLARRQGVALTALAPDREVTLRSDPFRLLLVLAAVIEKLTEVLESGGQIILQSPPAQKGVAVLLGVQGSKKAGWEGLADTLFPPLENILAALGAELALSSPPAPEGVRLTIKAGDS
jgi:C4-dicarboxylate-specific signal transduction histidine kinase